MRLGVLGTADIAFRRFLPALEKSEEFEYVGIATRTPEKAVTFKEKFGGTIYSSYDELISDKSIDAVYIPLPPALHYKWGKEALESGKHVLMEKPFTISSAETEELLKLAKSRNLAVHENYMFLYHSQLKYIKEKIAEGLLGDIRLYRMAFGFPKRGENDFRYNKALGGGALLDCGGYPLRLVLELLGESTHVVQSKLVTPKGYEVDLYGNAVLENARGEVAQISFGMDNAYQCQLEIWGSKATLVAPRIFTAGAEFEPNIVLRASNGEENIKLKADDQFKHSIDEFRIKVLADAEGKEEAYNMIKYQMMLVDALQEMGK